MIVGLQGREGHWGGGPHVMGLGGRRGYMIVGCGRWFKSLRKEVGKGGVFPVS